VRDDYWTALDLKGQNAHSLFADAADCAAASTSERAFGESSLQNTPVSWLLCSFSFALIIVYEGEKWKSDLARIVARD